jgi:mRNA-degrading endonuclease RelE of RelBE toxin-antitoxin system
MSYGISWRRRAEKDLGRLDRMARNRVIDAVERYAATREGDIRRLQDIMPPLFRLRIGDLRVLFRVENDDSVVIERVLPRDKAYK